MWSVLCLGFLVLSVQAQSFFGVTTTQQGAYSVRVGNATWFSSGTPLTVFHDGGWSKVSDGTLVLKSNNSVTGSDKIGKFTLFTYVYASTRNASMVVHTRIRVYASIVSFEVSYPNGVNSIKNSPGTNGKDSINSVFPSFHVPDAGSVPRAYLSLSGPFVWSGRMSGVWGVNMSLIPTGLSGTTAVGIFAKDLSASCVISPSQSPMGINMVWDSVAQNVNYGSLASYSTLPIGFTMSTVISCVPSGANDAYLAWGSYMRTLYGTNRAQGDKTLSQLGYSTDNGAYYYYNVESNNNYEQTMLDVQKYLVSNLSIPIKYTLLDSWWYYKGLDNGVKTWEAMPTIFPDGMKYLSDKMGMPFQLHNRYWSSDNTYSTQNGGAYPFITDTQMAVPTSQQFWNDLIKNATLNGMIVYEQDWLYNELQGVSALLTNQGLSEQWLSQMATGAANNGVTIQYCMPYARHLLESLKLNSVVQARASDDYRVTVWGRPQWQIGMTTLLYRALDLAPSKDVFWSTQSQPGNPYNPSFSEAAPALQAAVSVFSRGPVAFGDAVGYTDRNVVMGTSRADGVLLQPTVGATAVDEQFISEGFQSGDVGPLGQVWTAYADIGVFRAWYILTAELVQPWKISLSRFNQWYNGSATQVAVYEPTSTLIAAKAPNGHLNLDICNVTDFKIYTITASLPNGYYFLGEEGKYVRISPQRFTSFTADRMTVQMTIAGAVGESITLIFAQEQCKDCELVLKRFVCVVGSSGTVPFDLVKGGCV
eukprot:PhF_6_TR22322/c0_g1_i1/m.31596